MGWDVPHSVQGGGEIWCSSKDPQASCCMSMTLNASGFEDLNLSSREYCEVMATAVRIKRQNLNATSSFCFYLQLANNLSQMMILACSEEIGRQTLFKRT